MAKNKLYTQSVMKDLRDAIINNKATIFPYKDYSFVNTGIKSCGVFMRLIKNASTGFIERYMMMPDEMPNSIYKIWQEFPIYKFIPTDYKTDKRDFIGNTVYSKVSYNINGKYYNALIRKLVEATDETISEEERVAITKEYCDLVIDGRFFTILKVVPCDEDVVSWGMDDRKAMITFESSGENFSLSVPDDSDEYYNDNTEENQEDPLF